MKVYIQPDDTDLHIVSNFLNRFYYGVEYTDATIRALQSFEIDSKQKLKIAIAFKNILTDPQSPGTFKDLVLYSANRFVRNDEEAKWLLQEIFNENLFDVALGLIPDVSVIYSAWSADKIPVIHQVQQVLEILDPLFDAGDWTSGFRSDNKSRNNFLIEKEEVKQIYSGELIKLWEKTVSRFKAKDKLTEELYAYSISFFKEINIETTISFSHSFFSIGIEEHVIPKAFEKYFDNFLNLFKKLGSIKEIGCFWFWNHSAFAGDPYYLYQPEIPFSKLCKITSYEVIDEVRKIRDFLQTSVTRQQIVEILTELGLHVEPLSDDRIFVQLGEPGKDEGKEMMQKIEKQIKGLL